MRISIGSFPTKGDGSLTGRGLFFNLYSLLIVLVLSSKATFDAVPENSASGVKRAINLVQDVILHSCRLLSSLFDSGEFRVDLCPLTSECSVPNLNTFAAKSKQC